MELAEESLALVEGLEICFAVLQLQLRKPLLIAAHFHSPQTQQAGAIREQVHPGLALQVSL